MKAINLNPRISPKARKYISGKISKLMREGKAQIAAIGQAFRMARAKGFSLPKKRPKARGEMTERGAMMDPYGNPVNPAPALRFVPIRKHIQELSAQQEVTRLLDFGIRAKYEKRGTYNYVVFVDALEKDQAQRIIKSYTQPSSWPPDGNPIVSPPGEREMVPTENPEAEYNPEIRPRLLRSGREVRPRLDYFPKGKRAFVGEYSPFKGSMRGTIGSYRPGSVYKGVKYNPAKSNFLLKIDRSGNITLFAPDGRDVFFQGDDARTLMGYIGRYARELDKGWDVKIPESSPVGGMLWEYFGNDNPGLFNTVSRVADVVGAAARLRGNPAIMWGEELPLGTHVTVLGGLRGTIEKVERANGAIIHTVKITSKWMPRKGWQPHSGTWRGSYRAISVQEPSGNGTPNIPGYIDASGTFHPIRASKSYDPYRTGERVRPQSFGRKHGKAYVIRKGKKRWGNPADNGSITRVGDSVEEIKYKGGPGDKRNKLWYHKSSPRNKNVLDGVPSGSVITTPSGERLRLPKRSIVIHSQRGKNLWGVVK